MSIKKKFLASCFLLLALALPAMAQTSQTASDYVAKRIQLTLSNAPQPVPNASVFVSGNPGPATYYYWIVTQTSVGASSPAGPFQVINAPNTLTVSNFNQISWTIVPGSTYDVLRTSNTGPPFGACNCAVATAVVGNSVSDQSNALIPYTLNTLDPSTRVVTLQNFNGTLSLGTTPVPLLQVCDASTYPGADWSVQDNNALADPGCGWVNGANLTPGISSTTVIIPNNKRLIMPCGTFTGGASVNPVIQVNNFGGLIGFDRNCTVFSTNSPTADIIAVNTSTNWGHINDLTVQAAVARTGGAGIRVSGGHGVIERVVINPVFDGMTFDTASASGDNVVRDVEITDGTGSPGPGSGGAWRCGICVGGVASGTVSGNSFHHVTISMRTAFSDAGFAIKDGADTTSIDGNSQAVANIGGVDSVAFHIERVNGGSQPALTTISNSVFEGGLTKNTIVVDSGLNTTFTHITSQSGLRGAVINGGNKVAFIASTFHLNNDEGVQINSGSSDVSVINSRFSENSQATTNTFDDIFVAANTNTFHLIGNTHQDFVNTGKICKWGIEVAAGTSNNYDITDDINPGSCGTGALTDSGTGLSKRVCSPGAACNMGNSAIQQMGSTSGTVTIQPAAIAGNPSLTWATASGVVPGVSSGTGPTLGTAIAAGTCQAQTSITIANALTSDSAVLNVNAALPASWQTGIYPRAEVQSAGACVPILCNPTAGSITPVNTTVRCTTTHTQ
jgi:hypothetical protein